MGPYLKKKKGEKNTNNSVVMAFEKKNVKAATVALRGSLFFFTEVRWTRILKEKKGRFVFMEIFSGSFDALMLLYIHILCHARSIQHDFEDF